MALQLLELDPGLEETILALEFPLSADHAYLNLIAIFGCGQDQMAFAVQPHRFFGHKARAPLPEVTTVPLSKIQCLAPEFVTPHKFVTWRDTLQSGACGRLCHLSESQRTQGADDEDDLQRWWQRSHGEILPALGIHGTCVLLGAPGPNT
jgi:hypothetical protein